MGLIDKYHVDSKYIIFEITENTYIHNVEAVNRMIQLFPTFLLTEIPIRDWVFSVFLTYITNCRLA